MKDSTAPKKRNFDQLIEIYNAVTPEDNTYRNCESKITKEENTAVRENAKGQEILESEKEKEWLHKRESIDKIEMEDSDSEANSDERHYTNTIYHNKVNIEMNADGNKYNFYPIQQDEIDMTNHWSLHCGDLSSNESTPTNDNNQYTYLANHTDMESSEFNQDRSSSVNIDSRSEKIDMRDMQAKDNPKKRVRPKNRTKNKRGKKKKMSGEQRCKERE